MTKRFAGHFDIEGSGYPILCIPGFASGNWIFGRLIAPLAGEFQFILPDNRGMGRSPHTDVAYSLDDLAADALDLMDDLGYESFGLIGLSMGGFIGQLLALRVPERVRAMVLMCTTSAGDEFKKVFPALSEQQIRAIYQMEPEARVVAALSPAICPLLKAEYPETYGYVVDRRVADPADPGQVMQQFFAVSAFMENALPLGNIRCPTLILAGDQDVLVPRVNAEMLRDRMPNAQLAIIADSDHMFFLEKSLEVSGKIGMFFDQVGVGA